MYEIIITKRELYDKCENMEELYDNFYCPLLVEYKELKKKSQELKRQLEEYQKELEKADSITQSCIFNGKEESKISFRKCLNILDKKETQQKEFIKYLEDEKDRLASECSNIYEDSLGKTRLVNEDIFNEVSKVSQKYKSIIGDDKK